MTKRGWSSGRQEKRQVSNEIEKVNDLVDAEFVEAHQVHPPEMSRRQQFIKGLRDIAALYEREVLLPLPTDTTFNIFPEREMLPIIAHALGKCEKDVLSDEWFMLRRSFGSLLKIEANWNRKEVCTRIVVGTEQVTEKVPISFEERTVTKEIVEWHCPGAVTSLPPERLD
jgi:hypothetical protein